MLFMDHTVELFTNYNSTDMLPECLSCVQLTSSRVRLGQSFKTVGYGSASCWGDVGPEV